MASIQGACGGGDDGRRPTRKKSFLSKTLSFRRRSFKPQRYSLPTHHNPSFWVFDIFETYIKASNCHDICSDIYTSELPCLPGLNIILQERFHNFSFSTLRFGGNCSEVTFLMAGCQSNPVTVIPVLVPSSERDIPVSLRSTLTETVMAKTLNLYIFPITLVKPHGVYLKVVKDENQTRVSTTCAQEGAHLTSPEPQVFVCGHVTVSDGHRSPFMLTQKTDPFTKKYCRIHTTQGEVCPVNSVKANRRFVRVSIEESFLKNDLTSCIKVGMTMVENALISFKYNPYVFTPWIWGHNTTPIHYAGPPVIIPSGQTVQVMYKNVYYASLLPDITALITNDRDNDKFQIMEAEWNLKNPVILSVTNLTCCLQLLKRGQLLGHAFFFIAPKLPMSALIPHRYRDNLSAAFTISGGITINATKLHKLCKLGVPQAHLSPLAMLM
ncbi:hypothetical protein [Rhinolophus gammaherpesvirus 1]|uniref:Uncharacterized protein n=1 Tax=Rhinolophus gammaherpesvirus 1 TaxID=2054179 RepID=A0A2Z5UHU7_9GAMA|nr:hypothetical protein [Rhinolophus gammaherpesvirus 1]BBB06462.1 hypothetical protein [Rhinolophus gammaherpesvirus 1]